MFENAKRKRLTRRLLRAIGLADSPYIHFLLTQISIANYPEGVDPLPIPPIVDAPSVARVTADFLGRRVGTINGLYRAIWGMSPREYVARLEEHLGEEPA